MRIVTLLPSATDIVAALGGTDQLVGISHSCSPSFDLPRLTSTNVDVTATSSEIDRQVREISGPLYNLDIELLEELKPDLIVSQSLCDVCAVSSGDVEEAVCSLPGSPTLVNLEPHRLAEVPLGFKQVAAEMDAEDALISLLSVWDDTMERNADVCEGNIAFLDWLDPPFAAGHWIPDILELIGCTSSLARPGEPSYTTTWDAVRDSNPDRIIAACCGFSAARGEEDTTPQDLRIEILDGYQTFSRPSPRLMRSIETLVGQIMS